MGKIKGEKQSLLNFLNQLVTRAYHQCRYYCAHPALSLPATTRLDRFWLALIRMTVVAAAGFLCILILINTPLLVTRLSAALLGTDASLVPGWISAFFSILYTFFILTVCFPFLLALGWVPLSRYEKNLGVSVPFVSIIIPAFNEEQSIMRSLTALKQLDYPRFEIIVINDGSTDFTYSVIEQAQVNYIHLRQNQGKAAALNAGIAQAKGAIIVFSDSDSWLHPMALRYLIEGFSSPKTGAVSGTVEIEQASNLLEKWQVIEYIFGQFFVKIAQLGSGSSVAICPGPVCAFRKDLLLKVGGFRNRTITEDFDTTLAIIKAGYLVNYAPKAVAYTDAPATWKALKYQRLRWFRGHLQTFRLHRDLLFQPSIGALGLYWLPVYYLFLGYVCSTLELLLMPVIPLVLLVSGSSTAMLQVSIFYIFFAHLFISIGYSIILHHSRRLSWELFLAACMIYPYLFFLNWLRLCAITDEARGKIATWSG